MDATSGEAPLTVNFDATGSTDPDSTNLTVNVYAFRTFDSVSPVTSPSVIRGPGGRTGTVTFPAPGSWRLWFIVTDEKGNSDSFTEYFFVTPASSQLDIAPATGGASCRRTSIGRFGRCWPMA